MTRGTQDYVDIEVDPKTVTRVQQIADELGISFEAAFNKLFWLGVWVRQASQFKLVKGGPG